MAATATVMVLAAAASCTPKTDTIGILYEGSGACLVYLQVKISEILNSHN